MNQVHEQFAGLERYHLQQNHLPAFDQFLNGHPTTSNVIIHLNGSAESIMQSTNLDNLQSEPASVSRKRKRSSASDSTFKCSFCPKKFVNQSLVSLNIVNVLIDLIVFLVERSFARLSIDKNTCL